MKCKYRHHTNICDRQEREKNSLNEVSLTGYTSYAEERVLPAIIPVSIEASSLGLGPGRTRANFVCVSHKYVNT